MIRPLRQWVSTEAIYQYLGVKQYPKTMKKELIRKFIKGLMWREFNVSFSNKRKLLHFSSGIEFDPNFFALYSLKTFTTQKLQSNRNMKFR